VFSTGRIKWRGHRIFISEAMGGEFVGLAQTEGGDRTVLFLHVELGRLERGTGRSTPAWHGDDADGGLGDFGFVAATVRTGLRTRTQNPNPRT
jgi:hypothetical protein